MTFETFINYKIIAFESYSLSVYTVVAVVLIVVVTVLISKGVRKILFSESKLNKIEKGSAFALFKLTKYILWIIAIALILDVVGANLTGLLVGSAALLVGIGLGLQHTFNDFISGIILLIENTTAVGDVLEVEGEVVLIQNIGLRTSRVINRDDIIMIIPNSLITTNKVINWSHQSKKTRFRINIGVAYGSNVDLVIKVLAEAAGEHPEIKDKSSIKARFLDFGNSSLDFELLFFSKNVFRIENVKSDIRKIINQKFIENKITIPFPQMDVYLKK
ncbi:MAG: mechanosensitive ion channel [Flavobacteriales bacterium]|nr:mechanosensitive ion channel [Flavobacteriales bacterium]NQX96670.1 mechanosensitive ion channel [Flavobacteriales bacterium]